MRQVQGMLFDGEERVRQSQVVSVADQIKARFGTAAIRRGSGLENRREAQAELRQSVVLRVNVPLPTGVACMVMVRASFSASVAVDLVRLFCRPAK